MKRRQAFTLIELLVVISIIALLIAILLPALGAARQSARQMRNSVNLRSLHTAMVVYAEENKGYYPGLASDGTVMTGPEVERRLGANIFGVPGDTVAARFGLIAGADVVAPEHIISPEEIDGAREVWDGTSRFSHINISYAALDLGGITSAGSGDQFNQSLKSWSNETNSQTPVMSDRNTSLTSRDPGSSVWDESSWAGGVSWNDGHVAFEGDHILDTTQLGNITNQEDPLFDFGTTSVDSELRRRGQHVRMIKFNTNSTVGPFGNPAITP